MLCETIRSFWLGAEIHTISGNPKKIPFFFFFVTLKTLLLNQLQNNFEIQPFLSFLNIFERTEISSLGVFIMKSTKRHFQLYFRGSPAILKFSARLVFLVGLVGCWGFSVCLFNKISPPPTPPNVLKAAQYQA